MAIPVGSLVDILPRLPCKVDVQGHKLVLHVEGGTVLCKQVIMDSAWQLEASVLAGLMDASLVSLCTTEIRNDSIWVTLSASEAKQQSHGFGLQCSVPAGQGPSAPGVPEPWMGTYGEKLPVIPQDMGSMRGGLERQRMQSRPKQDNQRPAGMRQATLSSMFAAAPINIQPMDF